MEKALKFHENNCQASETSQVFEVDVIFTCLTDIWSDQFICWIVFVIIIRNLRASRFTRTAGIQLGGSAAGDRAVL